MLRKTTKQEQKSLILVIQTWNQSPILTLKIEYIILKAMTGILSLFAEMKQISNRINVK